MNRMVFFRVGWMKEYVGRIGSDPITNGGSWPDKGEVYNFSLVRGRHYGYVQPPANATGINLPRIDPTATGSEVTDVTVVWLANRPGGGTYVIGWYRNATVYAWPMSPPSTAQRTGSMAQDVPYFAKAKAEDCRLLEQDERQFEVPRGKGYPGRSNVFYQDANPAFAAKVLAYISTGRITAAKPVGRAGRGKARQQDIFKRLAVEKAAIALVAAHYRALGYDLNSVERDNLGWDLTATYGRVELHLEVKGLSGPDLVAELTPNEYRHLLENALVYRLCIVCNTLTSPLLEIFSFDYDTGHWTTASGRILHFKDMVSARVSA